VCSRLFSSTPPVPVELYITTGSSWIIQNNSRNMKTEGYKPPKAARPMSEARKVSLKSA